MRRAFLVALAHSSLVCGSSSSEGGQRCPLLNHVCAFKPEESRVPRLGLATWPPRGVRRSWSALGEDDVFPTGGTAGAAPVAHLFLSEALKACREAGSAHTCWPSVGAGRRAPDFLPATFEMGLSSITEKSSQGTCSGPSPNGASTEEMQVTAALPSV